MYWQAVRQALQSLADRKLNKLQLGQLIMAWKGMNNFLGWAGVAPALDPTLRASLGYVMGRRYLALGKPQDAAALFRAAAEGAAAGSAVGPLAQREFQAASVP